MPIFSYPVDIAVPALRDPLSEDQICRGQALHLKHHLLPNTQQHQKEIAQNLWNITNNIHSVNLKTHHSWIINLRMINGTLVVWHSLTALLRQNH